MQTQKQLCEEAMGFNKQEISCWQSTETEEQAYM